MISKCFFIRLWVLRQPPEGNNTSYLVRLSLTRHLFMWPLSIYIYIRIVTKCIWCWKTSFSALNWPQTITLVTELPVQWCSPGWLALLLKLRKRCQICLGWTWTLHVSGLHFVIPCGHNNCICDAKKEGILSVPWKGMQIAGSKHSLLTTHLQAFSLAIWLPKNMFLVRPLKRSIDLKMWTRLVHSANRTGNSLQS